MFKAFIKIKSVFFSKIDKPKKTNFLQARNISKAIQLWLGDGDYEKVSIGQNCNSAWYLKQTNNKFASYPFDWIFSNAEIVALSVKDKFKSFLDRSLMFSISNEKAGHLKFHSSLFNHRNPLNSDNDFLYYQRSCNRFLNLLKSEKNILFVCTVIQEKAKRKGWSNGFDKKIILPKTQSLGTFKDMVHSISRINSKSKFIFINQFTEGKLEIEIKEKNDKCLWIDFYSKGKNDGVKYLEKIDDDIMKIIYESFKS